MGRYAHFSGISTSCYSERIPGFSCEPNLPDIHLLCSTTGYLITERLRKVIAAWRRHKKHRRNKRARPEDHTRGLNPGVNQYGLRLNADDGTDSLTRGVYRWFRRNVNRCSATGIVAIIVILFLRDSFRVHLRLDLSHRHMGTA